MGPTQEQTDAMKQHVERLHELVVKEKAVDWNQVAQIIAQIVQLILSSHVK